MQSLPDRSLLIVNENQPFQLNIHNLTSMISADKECIFRLYCNHGLIAESINSVMIFSGPCIKNQIMLWAGHPNKIPGGPDNVFLYFDRYDSLNIVCDTPNVTLTAKMHTL